MPAGRPTIFTPVLAERILSRMEQGESLRKICEDPEMPSRSAVKKWLNEDDEFAARYARACEVRTEGYVDEMVDIADDVTIPSDQKKHMLDTRKWVAVKLLPKKYGDRVEMTGRLSLEQLVGATMPEAE